MKLIGRYCKKYTFFIILAVSIKLVAAFTELAIPSLLEYIIDTVAPSGNADLVIICGVGMFMLALICRTLNVIANRRSIKTSSLATYELRRDLFSRVLNLSGTQTDEFGLPSLTSRMTSDSYNVQNFIRSSQTMGVRAPMLLIGGLVMTFTMDKGLAMILLLLTPVILTVLVFVSRKGIPLYELVQESVDNIVRIMRENITGIRVVKALSKEEYEIGRFDTANMEMTRKDRRAGIVMALPGPLMTLFLNIGLTCVVYFGARRVNAGRTEPGVILAFLTYFNMILMGILGLNRILIMMSRANASAGRIETVINMPDTPLPIPDHEAAVPYGTGYIVFDNVSFSYCRHDTDEGSSFGGDEPLKTLSNLSFEIPAGGTLGIIGATGSGKTTIIKLLMRFYEADEGNIFVDGKDVRLYDRSELRQKFGVVFQNDVIFSDTIGENIAFGRELSETEISGAAEDAMAAGFISEYEDSFDHKSDIHGANFSGGQKQRLLIARALAAHPDILVLDDSSSALDYKTDSLLRKAIRSNYKPTATIIIAQRISSIMNLDSIIMLEDGIICGLGTHEELLDSCPSYREIYETQMGEGDGYAAS